MEKRMDKRKRLVQQFFDIEAQSSDDEESKLLRAKAKMDGEDDDDDDDSSDGDVYEKSPEPIAGEDLDQPRSFYHSVDNEDMPSSPEMPPLPRLPVIVMHGEQPSFLAHRAVTAANTFLCTDNASVRGSNCRPSTIRDYFSVSTNVAVDNPLVGQEQEEDHAEENEADQNADSELMAVDGEEGDEKDGDAEDDNEEACGNEEEEEGGEEEEEEEEGEALGKREKQKPVVTRRASRCLLLRMKRLICRQALILRRHSVAGKTVTPSILSAIPYPRTDLVVLLLVMIRVLTLISIPILRRVSTMRPS
jgi:hypothetical protein